MKLFGESAPGEQQDGYLPGAWDEVRRAYMGGHISVEAYDLLREAMPKVQGTNQPLPWGEMPYDAKTPRQVVDDYVQAHDLSEEHAREQLADWIERYANSRVADAALRVSEGLAAVQTALQKEPS